MRSSIKVVIKNKKAVFIYAMFIMVMMITIINKKNLHVDEVSSYILSNNVGGISMDFKEGYTYMPTEQVYLDCVAANESERFNFRNVWKNQTDDVHPPFYYLSGLGNSLSPNFRSFFMFFFFAFLHIPENIFVKFSKKY